LAILIGDAREGMATDGWWSQRFQALNEKLRVPEIANLTRIHEQDVYKILPKLEQTGLITKRTTKPIIVEALPLEIALKGIIKKRKKILTRRKRTLGKSLKLSRAKEQSKTMKILKKRS
jgi:sugar-specific transcriptional regulator TrmB